MRQVLCSPPNRGDALRREILESEKGWTVCYSEGGRECFAIRSPPSFGRCSPAASARHSDIGGRAAVTGEVYSTRQRRTSRRCSTRRKSGSTRRRKSPRRRRQDGAGRASLRLGGVERGGGARKRIDPLIARLQALSRRKGWREYEPLKPATLTDASGQSEVMLGDSRYILFSQPYTFAARR